MRVKAQAKLPMNKARAADTMAMGKMMQARPTKSSIKAKPAAKFKK